MLGRILACADATLSFIGGMMDIAFSHMFEGCEYKIVVSRGSDPYVCQFRLKDGPGRYDCIKEDCLAVRSGLQHFNSMGGN